MKPKIKWIDLFCGIGGTSSGIHISKKGTVIACVNHDKNAIISHQLNHPKAKHFTEDVRNFNVVIDLKKMVEKLRAKEPNVIICIWASLECTNFSRAKGGQPKNLDSRTLAEHMYMYLEQIKPDYFFVENVKEFMDWGELDENGKPIAEKKGEDFKQWVANIRKMGFDYEHQILNAANYGACQSRERLFIQFAKDGYPINWPVATHAKKPTGKLKKWKAVKDVLDLNDEGKSIFGRKKPLVDATLERVYIGLIKEIAGGKEAFLNQYNSGDGRIIGIDNAINTVPTNNRFAIFKTVFLTKYYGTGDNVQSINETSPTATTKDRFALFWIDRQYGTATINSINSAIGTLPTNPKANLVTVNGFIVNPSHGGHISSLNGSSPTVIASQHKAPLYLVQTPKGEIPVFDMLSFFNDDDLKFISTGEGEKSIRIKIVEFMFMYGISDIKMRMLKISELLPIQGFPLNYKMVGTQAEQKKFIGNAVEVNQAKVLVNAHYNGLVDYLSLRKAS